MCVGQGWWPLLEQLDAELAVIFPDYDVVQVKEKYGDLRVYLETYRTELSEQLWEILFKYEKLSSQTCELCGQPGKHTKTSWIKTLCEECNKEPNAH